MGFPGLVLAGRDDLTECQKALRRMQRECSPPPNTRRDTYKAPDGVTYNVGDTVQCRDKENRQLWVQGTILNIDTRKPDPKIKFVGIREKMFGKVFLVDPTLDDTYSSYAGVK